MTRGLKFFSMSSLVVSVFALIVCLAPASAQTPQQASDVKQTPPANTNDVVRTPRQEAELRADLFMVRKQYSDAVDAYEKLVEQEPRNAILLNKLGIAYHLQSKLDEARKYYERATKADRKFANAYNNLGTIYYQRKKYSKAVPIYIKAVGLDPEMSVAFSNLGYAYFHMKKYDEAMDAFRHALTIDPEIFEHSSKTGSLLQDRTVLGDRGLFYFFLAKSFAARGDAEQCLRYLKRAADEGYASVQSARTDAAFKPVLRDPLVREFLQLEPLPQDPKQNIAPLGARGTSR